MKTQIKPRPFLKFKSAAIAAAALIGLAFTSATASATTIISPTGDGGFETGADFPTNGWTVVNGASNRFFVGPAPVPSAGTNAAFTGPNSTTWSGESPSSVNHFYRNVSFPPGETPIVLSFKYKITAPDPTFDFLRVFLVSTSTTPVAGTQLAGAGQIGSTYDSATSYVTVTIPIPAANAGTTQRLVFSWRTDGVAPAAAVAVDEISLATFAGLSGAKTIDNTLPTAGNNYASFTAAINDLNANGVGSGGVTFSAVSGQTFIEDSPVLTATGTAANPIVFQKSGALANPVIRPTGTAGTVDFGVGINGGDFITFDRIDVTINAASAVEYGFLVRNANSVDGAQNNTIQNTSITLNRANTASVGILQSSDTLGGGVTPATAAGGNSNNHYYNLTIQNAYAGIYLRTLLIGGDTNNEVGASVGATTVVGGAAAGDIGGGAVASWGIRALGQTNVKIFQTEVRNVSVTGSVAADGIFLDQTAGTSQAFVNKVHDIRNTSTTATTAMSGIRSNITTATTGNVNRVYNNFVWNILTGYTGAATATRQVKGIRAQDGGGSFAGNTHNIDFNSVRIDLGANLNMSSACFEIGTTTGPVMNVRNNIFANFTGAQAGVAKHYTWVSTSATAIGNTGSVSDRNDLYIANTTNGFVGLGAATDRATLANWQTQAAGVDANSIPTDPQFLTPTDLHIMVASPCVDNGSYFAGAITWVGRDIDNQDRVPPPDIGADEPSGTTPPNNDIAATAITNPPNGSAFAIGAVVTPQATFTNVGLATQTGVMVQFTITGPGGYSYTDTQTIATISPNQTVTVTFLPAPAFTTAGTYNTAATVITADANAANDQVTGSFQVLPALNGSYNVPGDYPSLTNAGGIFAALNGGGASGNVIINITANLTGETGGIALNEIAGGFTVTIKPDSAPRPAPGAHAPSSAHTISGASAGGLLLFNGTDNVTIDGSLSGGSDRSLTVTNTGAGGGIVFASGATGAHDNTVKNMNVIGGGPTTTTIGIAFGGNTFGTAGTDNDNNHVENCNLQASVYGIYSVGASAANKNTGTVITRNVMLGTGTSRIGRIGMFVGFDDGVQITQNAISGINSAEASDAVGIGVGLQSLGTTTPTPADVTNALVSRNSVGGVQQTNTFSAAGIALGSGTNGTNTVVNNMVSGVIANANAGDIVAGIYVIPVASATQNIYDNSVSMSGDRGTTADQYPSFALALTANQPVNAIDNILSNSQTRTGATGGGGQSYAIAIKATSFTNLTSDYNDLFVSGPLGVVGITGDFTTAAQTTTAGTGTNRTALSDWQTATGKDPHSIPGNPGFVNALTDLHIASISSPVANAGNPIGGVTVDFDGNSRSAMHPDIGADEFLSDKLSNLVASAGAISPVFNPNTNGYTLSVPHSTTSTTVTATWPDSNTMVTVNGNPVMSGIPSPSINLVDGPNVITVVVTPEFGPTNTYTITITRAALGPVTAMADSGPGTLRQKLADAVDGDTITFDIPLTRPDAPQIVSTITLTSGELVVDKNITIDGPGANVLEVTRDNVAPNFRIFHVNPGHTVTIEGMTISNGLLSGQSGAGILNDHSVLTVDSCNISDNRADFGGGGIFSDGSAGTATLTVTNCTIALNAANVVGGGIANYGEGTGSDANLIVTNSTISGNVTNFGAGIYNDGALDGSAMMTVNNSTFSANPAISAGGGIYNDGFDGDASLAVSNCTFYKNLAPSGGAIYTDGSSGGIATVDIGNTIVQTGATGADLQNSSSTITSHGYNLSSGGGAGALIATGDQINTDPMLGPLKNNGGPTLTHAPLINSPAIDQGKRDAILALTTNFDQRGLARPVNDPAVINAGGGDGSDIGAVEIQQFVHASSAASWKTHGGAGPFPIDLPFTGPVGIECRSGGTSNVYQIIVTFAIPVSVDDAAVTSGAGIVSGFTVTPIANRAPNGVGPGTQVTIDLIGVTNEQKITVALFDTDDGTNIADVGVRMGMLLGDVDSSFNVNGGTDGSAVKFEVGNPVVLGNFRDDVLANGAINSTDVSIVKLKSGTGLPAMP